MKKQIEGWTKERQFPRNFLRMHVGEMFHWKGTVAKFGEPKIRYNFSIPILAGRTICINNIVDDSGQFFIGHNWFYYTPQMEISDLKVGDKVAFDAEIVEYSKPGLIDYKLQNPTRLVKIARIRLEL